eukprot:1172512-Prorocentrum_minimum.AAC.1
MLTGDPVRDVPVCRGLWGGRRRCPSGLRLHAGAADGGARLQAPPVRAVRSGCAEVPVIHVCDLVTCGMCAVAPYRGGAAAGLRCDLVLRARAILSQASRDV